MNLLYSLVIVLSSACLAQAQAPLWPVHDFSEYYSAGQVFATGGNPYDGQALLPIQRELNNNPTQEQPTMLWTPPWTLPLYAPFGVLPAHLAQLLWAITQATMMLIGVSLNWRVYGCGLPWWGWCVAFAVVLTSSPVWWMFGYGQNTGLLVLGLGGYLYFRDRELPYLAGALGVLTAVKPHLLVLFALMLLIDMRNKTGRKVVLAGLMMLLLSSLLAVGVNPNIFSEFRAALAKPSDGTVTNVADWQLPLISYHLRWLIEPTEFRWQFLLLLLAVIVYPTVRLTVRRGLSITEELPFVLLVSVLVAPYGGWAFDLVVLLPVSLHGFARALRSKRTLPICLAVFGHLVILRYGALIGWLHEGWWLAPTVTVCWLLVILTTPKEQHE